MDSLSGGIDRSANSPHRERVQTFYGVPQTLGAFAGSVPLLAGDAGTAQTVGLAKKLVDAAVKDPAVNVFAIGIVRHTPQYDNLSKAEAIFDWVRANYYYIQDPIGPFGAKETLRPMRDQMQLCAGDCDDVNMVFIPSLLGTIGYCSRVVTIKADRECPNEFSHVYCEAKIDGEWIPMDCARPGAIFGEEPPYYWERKEWPITDDQPVQLLGGMGCADCVPGSPCLCQQPSRGLAGYVTDYPGLSGFERTLGDDSTTAQDISAASVGAAAVISAANQNPYSYLYTTNLQSPAGPALAASQLGYGPGIGGSIQVTSWVPFIVIGLFGLAVLKLMKG